MEGDAKHVLMDAVAKHHADILILGSHGYNNVQRFPLYFIFLPLYNLFYPLLVGISLPNNLIIYGCN